MLRLPLEATGGYDFDGLIAGGIAVLCVAVAVITVVVLFATGKRRAALMLGGVVLGLGGMAAAPMLFGALADARFRAADPGYAALSRPFTGRSLHIPDTCGVAYAAYGAGAADVGAGASCGLPIARLLRTGTLDFVEVGPPGGDVLRYAFRDGDPRCFSSDSDSDFDNGTLPGGLLSAPYGICIGATRHREITAGHEITRSDIATEGLGDRHLPHVELRDRGSGLVLDRFDGLSGAMPYGTATPQTHPRRPNAALAELLLRDPPPPDFIQRTISDRLLAARGLPSPALLRAAVEQGVAQAIHAEALFFACRDDVTPRLDAQTVSALDTAAKDLFSDKPTWTFPADCHPNLRRPPLSPGAMPTFPEGFFAAK